MPAAQSAPEDAGSPAQPAADTPGVSSQQQAALEAAAPDRVPASAPTTTASAEGGTRQPASAAAVPTSAAAPELSVTKQPAPEAAAPGSVPAPAAAPAPATSDALPAVEAAAAPGASPSSGAPQVPGSNATPPAAPALTAAQRCSVLGDVTPASGIAAGCRLARQLLVKLGDDPGGSSRYSVGADKLEIPKPHAHALLGTGTLERGYIAVAESGLQQLVTFGRGSLRSTHGFAPFRAMAGIPRGSHVTIAACHDNAEHLHVALAAAPSALQHGDAGRAAAVPVPSAPPPEKRSCIGVLIFVPFVPRYCTAT
jgi:hypothetical protein